MISAPRYRPTNKTVLHYTDASVFGGAEQMIVTLLANIDRGRWDPVLVHHGDSGLAELLERARLARIPTLQIGREQTGRDIGHLIRQTRPAIFHAHLRWPLACEEGLIAAARARTPGVVATQQLFVPPASRRGLLRHKLVSLAVDRYIAVSHHMGASLRDACFWGERKVRVVHNGTDLGAFREDARGNTQMNLPLPLGDGRPVVLTVARLVPQKGVQCLLEAAARLPDVLFLVAGEGPDRAALEQKAIGDGVGQRVVFLGHRRDVPQLLARCDVFVLPSLYEGLPVSVIEAMAAGKPVIATRVGGIEEAVKDRITGLLVPPADGTALAEALQCLLADRRLAQALGAQARVRADLEFSAEIVASRTTHIYESLVKNVPGSRVPKTVEPFTVNRGAARQRVASR